MKRKSSNENHQNPAASSADRDRCLFHGAGLDRIAVFAGQGALAIDRHPRRARIDASAFDALGTLQIYLWVAVFNAVVLISWARYQQRKSKSFAQRRLPAPVVDDQGLSKSFKLTGERLQKLRSPGSMTIHNDQDGDISHVVSHFFPITSDLIGPLAPLEHPRVIRLPAEDDTNREPLSHV